MPIGKALYVAHVTAVGGPAGRVVSSNGDLDVKLAKPQLPGEVVSSGTTPEQLFAGAYAAGFIAAMRLVADRGHITLPDDLSILATVGIGLVPSGFGMEVTLRVSVPGLPRPEVKSLIRTAHDLCAYSNATRGNIDVQVVVV
jgi:lipoyl-dependent peroxiredoxin